MILAAGDVRAQGKVRRGRMVQGRNNRSVAIPVKSLFFMVLSSFCLPETEAGNQQTKYSDRRSHREPGEELHLGSGKAGREFPIFSRNHKERVGHGVEEPELCVDHQHRGHNGGKPDADGENGRLNTHGQKPENCKHRNGRCIKQPGFLENKPRR